jgi:hypothetical protein
MVKVMDMAVQEDSVSYSHAQNKPLIHYKNRMFPIIIIIIIIIYCHANKGIPWVLSFRKDQLMYQGSTSKLVLEKVSICTIML